MLLMGEKIGAGLLAPFREHDPPHLLVGEVAQRINPPRIRRVRYGFDIEDQHIHRRGAFIGAASRGRAAHQHGHRNDQPGLIGQGHVPLADPQALAHAGAAR